MAKAFDQIYQELGSVYDPSVSLIQQQIDSLPASTDAAIAQADAKKNQAFIDITNSARSRGMGFSGIPLSEQATYASTEYAPAIANLKSNAASQKLGLLDSITSLNRDRTSNANTMYNTGVSQDLAERQFQEGIRQYNASLAASKAAAASGGSAADYLALLQGASGTAGPSSSTPAGSYGFKNGSNGSGGFYFTDASGNSISAAKYSKLTGTDMLTLINKMAQAGDAGAKSVLAGPGVNEALPAYKRYFAWDTGA
jgi:hypothetical protein